MKMLKGAKALPPLVDVEKPGNPHYWISPAIPWMPAREICGDNFSGIMLTACIVRGPKGKKFMELRLVRKKMVLKLSGEAMPEGADQVVAWGCIPLDKFMEDTFMPKTMTAIRYRFSFWEKKVEACAALDAGKTLERSQIVVDIHRGKDKPVKGFDSVEDAAMAFTFNEGAEKFRKWRDACAKEV